MICPSCGTQNSDQAHFCSTCGHQLHAHCPSCGKDVPQGASYCPSCGSPVQIGSTSTTERKLVTVLFGDLADSTGLAEVLDAEALHQVMTTFFEAMRIEIEAEGGTVEKYIGDAIMAAFGVPTTHEDDAARALRAALRMATRLQDLNEELARLFSVSLDLRIGINTGDVVANVDPAPGEALVTGDAVNAASRLQAAADPGMILVAERTARAVRGFRFSETDTMSLRGRSIPVRTLRLLGEEAGGSSQGVPGLHAPMVGRDSELSLLKTIYRRSYSDRQPNLVTIYGEPGVGKSRLVREFVDWADGLERPPTFLTGRCLPYGDGVTYWPLSEILTDVAGIRDSDSTEDALRRISYLGAALFANLEPAEIDEYTAALAYTVGLEDAKFSFGDLDPREVRSRTNDAWRHFFEALAADGPVVAHIEDIHWADNALLDLLELLNERVTGPVLFLCPARPGLADRRPRWGGGSRNVSSISLTPLTATETAQLAELLLRIEDVSSQIHSQILEKSGGNPFFLEEIIRNLIDTGLLRREGDGWVADAALESVEIPDTIQAALAARIDLLSPLEKRVLQRAAVVGRIFWVGAVAKLVDLEPNLVRDTFTRLEDRDLIKSRPGSSFANESEYIFRHVLTREVAYDSLPRADKGEAHARVARWISAITGDRADEMIELRVYHHVAAYKTSLEEPTSDPQRIEELRQNAFQAMLLASVGARRRYAIEKASKLAKQALTMADSPIEKAKALRQIGRTAAADYSGDSAWAALKESADLLLAHPPSDRREIARACAMAAETPTRWSGSMRTEVPASEVRYYIESGLKHLDPADESGEKVRLLMATAFAFQPYAGHSETSLSREEALSAGEQAAEMALRIGRPDLASAALDAVAAIKSARGNYDDAIPIVLRRLSLVPEIHNPSEVGDVYAMAAWTHAYSLSFKKALAYAEEGYELVRTETKGMALHTLNWVAYSEFWLGNWQRIRGEIAQAADALLSNRREAPYFASHYLGVRAFVSAATADSDLDLHEERLAEMVEPNNGQGSSIGAVWQSWISSRNGSPHKALRRIHQEVEEAPYISPFALLVEAEILTEVDLISEIPEFLVRAEAMTHSDMAVLDPYLIRLRALSEWDNPTAAKAQLKESLRGFRGLGARWDETRTRTLLANLYLSTGRHEKARRQAARALADAGAISSLKEVRAANSVLRRITD